VVDFTYKVLLSLGVVFQVNTILPKIRSPFHIFKKRYFRNSGLILIIDDNAIHQKSVISSNKFNGIEEQNIVYNIQESSTPKIE
jgi:hypothetical protein